jgi:hypothetical protein
MKIINKEIQRYKDVFLGCIVVRTFFADNLTFSNSFYESTLKSDFLAKYALLDFLK